MSVPLRPDDPAYWMLQRGIDEQGNDVPNTGWVKESQVDNSSCYICNDPEFALMGLPLCYPCVVCLGHTPADDTICDNGHDNQPGGF